MIAHAISFMMSILHRTEWMQEWSRPSNRQNDGQQQNPSIAQLLQQQQKLLLEVFKSAERIKANAGNFRQKNCCIGTAKQ